MENEQIALFIATEKGYTCLKSVIERGYAQCIGFVVSFKEIHVDKSYGEDIKKLCEKNNISFFYWKEVDKQIIMQCEKYSISIAFAIGWRYLIPIQINKIVRNRLIVFHDSLLPRYRGFAPTPTAIINGEDVIGVTALYATEEIDKGDIILQKKIYVDNEEYISDIIRKQAQVYAEMMIEILEQRSFAVTKQNEEEATYSIWRDEEDCRINWEESARDIYNLVRAVATPYPGAFCFYKGKKIVIDRVEVSEDINFAIRQPGKIWTIQNNVPLVICGQGIIKIKNAHYANGQEVIFDKLREKL